MGIEIEEIDIVEDLGTKHSLICKLSKETADNFMGYNILEQDWPPSSADLNPIE